MNGKKFYSSAKDNVELFLITMLLVSLANQTMFKMNVSTATIPQLFYDFIARVLPGFVFTSTLFIMLPQEIQVSLFPSSEQGTYISSFSNAMGLFFAFYIIGWSIEGLFHTLNPIVKSKILKTLKDSYPNEQKYIWEMYDWIRITNEPIGFRILKLKAEAKMIERLRLSMYLIFFIALLIILYYFYIDKLSILLVFKCITLLLLAINFHRFETKAWKRYYRSIINHHRLLKSEENKTSEKNDNLKNLLANIEIYPTIQFKKKE